MKTNSFGLTVEALKWCTKSFLLVALVSSFDGCISRDPPYELIGGQFRGTYRVIYPDKNLAKQEQARILEKLYDTWGPDERAKNGKPSLKADFYRWRQNDDHLRIDLYIEDLSKMNYEKGSGFRLALDTVDDVGNRIQRRFNNPQPGDSHYDVYHDSRVMGEWVGWHWGETKKDTLKRLREPQEFEWGLVEDQLAWARLHGTTRREAQERWKSWRDAHPEWNPYAFTTNRLVVLDGDPGTDDFAAMLILAKEGKRRAEHFPRACVATYGNASGEETLRNMLLGAWYLDLGFPPVIVRGASMSCQGGQPPNFPFQGRDGMGNVTEGLVKRFNLTEERLKRCTNSMDDLLTLIKQADEVIYIATGPLTTLVRLIEREPNVAEHIKRLYVAAGDTEINFRADVHALRQVFASGLDITLFPNDPANRRARLSDKDIFALEKIGRSSVAVNCFRQNLVSSVKASRTTDSAILHDALPALYALHPEKFQAVDRLLTDDHKGHVFESPEGRIVHVVTDVEQGLLFHSLSNAVQKCFEPGRNGGRFR